VQGQYNRNIAKSAMIAVLMDSGTPAVATASSSTASNRTAQASPTASTTPAPATPAVPAYKVGETGPAGGLIFYDKGNNSGGWRYLEAAPASTDREIATFSASSEFRIARDRHLGSGKENTVLLMEILGKRGGSINTAPWVCDSLVINGFDDWYQPSIEELIILYTNTYGKDRSGGFRPVKYWSSTYNPDGTVLVVDFYDGKEGTTSGNMDRVRAIRQIPGA